MKVTIHIKRSAEPQLIAPNGRWRFELHGRGFCVELTGGKHAYSKEEAHKDAVRFARRLGFGVWRTYYVDSN